jgi:hypothetical protein
MQSAEEAILLARADYAANLEAEELRGIHAFLNQG